MYRWIALIFLASLSPATAQQIDGQEAISAFQWCQAEATRECPRETIRCRSFRRAFIKACMIGSGVPPEYIRLLLDD